MAQAAGVAHVDRRSDHRNDRQGARMTLSTIVAGVDLSTQSEQAVARASALAQHAGAKLVLVNALADDAPIENIDNELLQQLGEVSAAMRAEVAKRLTAQLDALLKRGIDAELVSLTGPPGELVPQV